MVFGLGRNDEINENFQGLEDSVSVDGSMMDLPLSPTKRGRRKHKDEHGKSPKTVRSGALGEHMLKEKCEQRMRSKSRGRRLASGAISVVSNAVGGTKNQSNPGSKNSTEASSTDVESHMAEAETTQERRQSKVRRDTSGDMSLLSDAAGTSKDHGSFSEASPLDVELEMLNAETNTVPQSPKKRNWGTKLFRSSKKGEDKHVDKLAQLVSDGTTDMGRDDESSSEEEDLQTRVQQSNVRTPGKGRKQILVQTIGGSDQNQNLAIYSLCDAESLQFRPSLLAAPSTQTIVQQEQKLQNESAINNESSVQQESPRRQQASSTPRRRSSSCKRTTRVDSERKMVRSRVSNGSRGTNTPKTPREAKKAGKKDLDELIVPSLTHEQDVDHSERNKGAAHCAHVEGLVLPPNAHEENNGNFSPRRLHSGSSTCTVSGMPPQTPGRKRIVVDKSALLTVKSAENDDEVEIFSAKSPRKSNRVRGVFRSRSHASSSSQSVSPVKVKRDEKSLEMLKDIASLASTTRTCRSVADYGEKARRDPKTVSILKDSRLSSSASQCASPSRISRTMNLKTRTKSPTKERIRERCSTPSRERHTGKTPKSPKSPRSPAKESHEGRISRHHERNSPSGEFTSSPEDRKAKMESHLLSKQLEISPSKLSRTRKNALEWISNEIQNEDDRSRRSRSRSRDSREKSKHKSRSKSLGRSSVVSRSRDFDF